MSYLKGQRRMLQSLTPDNVLLGYFRSKEIRLLGGRMAGKEAEKYNGKENLKGSRRAKTD